MVTQLVEVRLFQSDMFQAAMSDIFQWMEGYFSSSVIKRSFQQRSQGGLVLKDWKDFAVLTDIYLQDRVSQNKVHIPGGTAWDDNWSRIKFMQASKNKLTSMKDFVYIPRIDSDC